MNERIKQLAKQAGYKHPDAVGECEDYAYFDHKEFAELIVEECINEIAYIGKAGVDNVINNHSDRTDRGGLNHILWTTETAIEKIREHFGVEK